MQFLLDMSNKFGIAAELMGFLWRAKMWWMMPIVFVLLLIGLLTVLGSAAGVGPFIYTLF